MNELLRAIIEAPDDDAPRLVYADWLQSQGDPRGEFIQLQCQLAAAPDDERRRAIKIAENKLFAAHGQAWLAPLRAALPSVHELSTNKFELWRGFVEEAQITIDQVDRFAVLFELAPLLRRLRLSPRWQTSFPMERPTLEGVLDAPQLSRLRTLELHLGGAGNPAAKLIAAASTLSNLTTLELKLSVWGESAGIFAPGTTDLVLDDDGIEMLARSSVLSKLETLILDGNRLTSKGVAMIAHGPWKLKRLELGNNAIEPETLARSLDGPALANLEVLGLSGIGFDSKSIAALVSSKSLTALRELDLERSHLGVEGTVALCKALSLPALRSLRIERNSVCDKGAFAIAECEAFSRLTNLEAGHNRMGHKAAVALAESPHLANLERLTLNEPRWKPETHALFAESPTLANAKIYLGGRLMGRKKSKAEATAKPATKASGTNAPAKSAAAGKAAATGRTDDERGASAPARRASAKDASASAKSASPKDAAVKSAPARNAAVKSAAAPAKKPTKKARE